MIEISNLRLSKSGEWTKVVVDIKSDFERVERQQRVMQIIYEKLKTYDLPSLIQFFYDVLPYVHTDLS